MFKLSNMPFVGLGFLFIGFVGFLVMAIILDDHPGLFAMIICWYALTISCAGFALGKDIRQTRLSDPSEDDLRRPGLSPACRPILPIYTKMLL